MARLKADGDRYIRSPPKSVAVEPSGLHEGRVKVWAKVVTENHPNYSRAGTQELRRCYLTLLRADCHTCRHLPFWKRVLKGSERLAVLAK